MYDPYKDFTKHVLPNGLEVHCAFWDRPWIVVEIVVHSGAQEDPIVLPGLAHFVEHLVSQNIPGWGSDQAKQFFESCGGQYEFGTTYYHSTRYSFKVPADLNTFRIALAIFGLMLLWAKLDKDVERERKVITREFNGCYPFLEKMEWDLGIHKALFKGHRVETYNRPIGRPEGFLAATQAGLQGFYDTHYVPANMSMSIVGGLFPVEVVDELGRSPFGMSKGGVRNLIPPPLHVFPIPAESTRAVKISDYSKLTVDMAAYQVAWAFPLDFPRQARRVFDQMLWQIMFEEIREKRSLAYSISTDIHNFLDVYEYSVVSQVAPSAVSNMGRLVQECIAMVPTKPDLFQRKLRSCILKCEMTDLSGGGLADDAAGDLALFQRIIGIEETLANLEKVTFEQMAEAASFLAPDRCYTFITRP